MSLLRPIARRLGAALFLVALACPSDAKDCSALGAGQFAREIEVCVSSALSPQGGNSYLPKGMMDGDPRTAWCAASVPGENIWIEIHVTDGSAFRRLLVQNGYGKSAETFSANSRPRRLAVSVDGGPARNAQLPDTHEMTTLDLPAAGQHRTVRLEVQDVYPGARYADVCLDYLMPDFEHEEELLQRQQPSQQEKPTIKVQPAPSDPFEDLDPLGKDLDLEHRP